jgi:hypothetical protein
MSILPTLASQFQSLFPATRRGQERARWFILTLQAILVPITASRTSNLLRAIATLFGVTIAQSRYYTFMASVKLPWVGLWERLWRAIPNPLTDGRLLVALDDSINAKSGRKVFACQRSFDHAAKVNQSQYPWAQTLVTVGLLKVIHGRWSCLPLAFAFYLRYQTLHARCIRVGGQALVFQTKFAQAVRMIGAVAKVFAQVPVLVVADSCSATRVAQAAAGGARPTRPAALAPAGQYGALRPAGGAPGSPGAATHVWGAPGQPGPARRHPPGRGPHLHAQPYGGVREVTAAERLVMLKTLHCQVRVVWVFRRTQWVALVTTDLALRWHRSSGSMGRAGKSRPVPEIKQEIGSAETQTRNPDAVTNHLNFCLAATTLTWIYGAHLEKAPPRRYATARRTEYAFGDLRRALAKDLGAQGFGIDCQGNDKTTRNPLIAAVMDLVA